MISEKMPLKSDKRLREGTGEERFQEDDEIGFMERSGIEDLENQCNIGYGNNL